MSRRELLTFADNIQESGYTHSLEIPRTTAQSLLASDHGSRKGDEPSEPSDSDRNSSSDSGRCSSGSSQSSQGSPVTSDNESSEQQDEDAESNNDRKRGEPTPNENKCVAIDIDPPSKLKGFVLFGVQGSKRLQPARTRLAQIDIEVYKDDNTFFDEMAVQYTKLRGLIRGLFSIWGFRSCELISVSPPRTHYRLLASLAD